TATPSQMDDATSTLVKGFKRVRKPGYSKITRYVMKNKVVFPALLLSSSVLLAACGGSSDSSSAVEETSRTVVGTLRSRQ
ncbi:MAG: hypothetical protein VW274_09300, partial [Thalassolituus sp.]